MAQLIFFVFLLSATPDPECINWFQSSKIKQDTDCLLTCSALRTDMATFTCPNSCDELCKSKVIPSTLFQITDLYPGLTQEERALAALNPKKIITAYQLSWKAEGICRNIYKSSQTNDESDACRHFCWAALLYQEFGMEFSNQILNAHEQDPKQPEQEKAMDLANNRLGLITAENLKKKSSFNEKNLLESFKDNLAKRRLVVLRKNIEMSSREEKK